MNYRVEKKSKSNISMMVSEIKSSLESLPGFQVCKVNWTDNSMSHNLAGIGNREWIRGVLLILAPPRVVELDQNECNGVCKVKPLAKKITWS
jgi:hypothetical protein